MNEFPGRLLVAAGFVRRYRECQHNDKRPMACCRAMVTAIALTILTLTLGGIKQLRSPGVEPGVPTLVSSGCHTKKKSSKKEEQLIVCLDPPRGRTWNLLIRSQTLCH